MTVITESEARANLNHFIALAAQSQQPVHITGTHASAVLVAAEDWASIQETLQLLSVPGMRESIRQAMAEPLENSAKCIPW